MSLTAWLVKMRSSGTRRQFSIASVATLSTNVKMAVYTVSDITLNLKLMKELTS